MSLLIATYGENTTTTQPEYVLHDEIVMPSGEEIELIMRKPEVSTPNVEKHQKLKEVRAERICDVAESIVHDRLGG